MKNLLLIILIIAPIQIFAHLGSISGMVSEKGSNSKLVGAIISLTGTTKTAITNELGQFKFNGLVEATYKIEVSNIGYNTIIENVLVKSDENTTINFQLETSLIRLNEIVISSKKSFNQQLIGKIDIKLRPINNSQELLRMVPGLFIGQHAGGGKAEQIFLRGFDIDHGTDINISTDGIPVNMVSHAHGQGYADLHFIIPELISEVKFQKGPYQATKGNFATAGYVELNTKSSIANSEIKLEAGQFDSYRAMGIFDILGEKGKTKNQAAYLAADYNFSNGYFENPQNFNRLNLTGKYHGHLGKNTLLTASLSTFSSIWKASGQIPERAVANGTIGFFGAIDPNEGGETSRKNVNIQMVSNNKKNNTIKNQIYYSNYDFKLYSNFTFFLNDSINGDQIKQAESRNLLGYNGSFTNNKLLGNKNLTTILGINIRHDATNNTELSHSKNRNIVLQNIKLGDITETNSTVFIDETIQITDKMNINTGLRLDYFEHQYLDKLSKSKLNVENTILSPKFNINYTFNNRSQLYLYTGKGFHTNDTRVVVAQSGIKTLPAAYGADLGLFLKPFEKLLINPVLWYLWLDQEFIYVGDEGVVEPAGRTRRYGFDFSARYQITEKLYFDLDYNTTKPQAVGLAEGQNYLPLAPINTSTFGVSYLYKNGLSGTFRGRFLGNRPANEDNSIVAKGYLVNDINFNFTKPKYNIGLSIQNVFNTKWKETQFATESRLQSEIMAVEEIHFTPGTPFFAKINYSIKF